MNALPVSGARRAAIRAEAARLRAAFEATGAQPVECAILQSAETLLDLYGEEIRGRAYVTQDPALGERMLRPDFTVPVVEMHMAEGAEPARYTYAGEVFRRQEERPERASEYLQVGIEIFDGTDPEAVDADIFAVIAEQLSGLDVTAVTGDIGILTAAVTSLDCSGARRQALLRHLWRPRRFRALLDRYSGRAPMPPTRRALLARADPLDGAGPVIGLRSRDEIAARIAALQADAEEPPIPRDVTELIDTLLRISDPCPKALAQLHDLARDLPGLAPAIARFDRRCDALAARGIDVDGLQFETAFGRSSMEYYDGFVFGFMASARSDLSPVATGGRYDALTARLGQGAAIPAAGGVIRPDLCIALAGERPCA
jgi:ATP phosphoribosyltransferase regulatory subunit